MICKLPTGFFKQASHLILVTYRLAFPLTGGAKNIIYYLMKILTFLVDKYVGFSLTSHLKPRINGPQTMPVF